MPPNSLRDAPSVPMKATRRRSRTSSSFQEPAARLRPLGAHHPPYDAATPRTRWLELLVA